MEGHGNTEIASVLFLDLVGYSLLSAELQPLRMSALHKVVDSSPTYKQAKAKELLVVLDTGDGAALAFFDEPRLAAQCATEVAAILRGEPDLPVRIGVHLGPISRTMGLDGKANILGPGVNIAQRVMDLSDAGHILISGSYAELLASYDDWKPLLADLGEFEIKHGVRLRVSRIAGDGFGSHDVPPRLFSLRGAEASSGLHHFVEDERPFIGREHELETLRKHLVDSARRLLTITGIGGIGKTRLATQAAREGVAAFPDGAWLIECENLTSREELVAKISAVMSLGGEGPSEDSLCEALGDSRTLLVFDCFERIVTQAPLLEKILQRTRQPKFLVTSRTVLGLPREYELPLGPMSLAKKRNELADATELFVEAAGHADPDFRISRRNRQIVAALVELLEAVPLSIVLAASRLRYMSLAELKDQLSKRKFDVLKRRAAGTDKHATLLQVVEGSFALLSEEERTCMLRLSVFQGGFFLSDVEEIFGDPDLLDLLASLRDNSLLIAPPSTYQTRYRMLDTIKEYLDRVVGSSGVQIDAAGHAAHYTAVAESIRLQLDSAQWEQATQRLWPDVGNFRAAFRYAIQSRNAELAHRLAFALARPYLEAGLRAEFEHLVSGVEEFGISDQRLLAEIRGLQSEANRRDGNFLRAIDGWREQAALFQSLGDLERYADSLVDIAQVSLDEGYEEPLANAIERLEALEHQLPSGTMLAGTLALRAKARLKSGDKRGALTMARRAEEITESWPPDRNVLYPWAGICAVYRTAEDYPRAKRLCRKHIAAALDSTYLSSALQALLELSQICEQAGEPLDALRAASVASRVPRSVHPRIAGQAMARKRLLAEHMEPQISSEIEGWIDGLGWESAAKDLALSPL